jgi:acetylornithine/N-succinyldiaminopimelate aminotransferase
VSQQVSNSSLLPVYNRSNIVMVRGVGVHLYDENGRQYLDFASGIAVNSLGHSHSYLINALKEQSDNLWHCSNLYRNPQLEKFAKKITQNSFADFVFATNSGTEAVETAIKMIRRFHYVKGTEKPEIITIEGGFHGRSLACISAGKSEKAVAGFAPLLQGFVQVPFGDLEALKSSINNKTGGIMLETIQGEGGIRPQPKQYLQDLRKIADENGILLFLDEVQCGVSRTGSLFAFEDYEITPDICSIAKGIGGGFPIGACLATTNAAIGMTIGTHGGTYGGNPLAMSVANAVLDVMLEVGFMENVIKMGKLLKEELQKLAIEFPHIIEEVRGVGLMLGLKMNIVAQNFVENLRNNGLLTVASAAGNVIRILPPLIINEIHIANAINIIKSQLIVYRS